MSFINEEGLIIRKIGNKSFHQVDYSQDCNWFNEVCCKKEVIFFI
jgi:hypothetical protein